MLSQHWRRQARAALLPDERHGMTHAVEMTSGWMVVLHDDLVGFGVRMFEELSERIDRRTGDTDLVERGVPRFDRSRRNHCLHMRQRFRAMPDPIRIGAEFGIVHDRLEPRDSAELAPEVVIGHLMIGPSDASNAW